ncbi:MAG: homoserine kinase [Burkholderiales bacterium]|jgi:homoserine kinase type II|nr:homoserine kinase [Burkholderiales bacterium]
MAVYTVVNETELSAWLADYGFSTLQKLEPITTGIENTNYFITADDTEWVLTLYERLPADDLPFYLNLMRHLAHAGVPVPQPRQNNRGDFFSQLYGKPATLIERARGAPQMQPVVQHCMVIGATLARMHVAVTDFSQTLNNPRGEAWRGEAAQAVRPFLNTEQQALLDEEMRAQQTGALNGLPGGAIHADLFRDNVLFIDPEKTDIGGIIDFGFAATGAFLYDLAITVNDWCIADASTGALDQEKLIALLAAYQRVRPIDDDEKTYWTLALRCAALRFWLSRLYDYYLPRDGAIVRAHDPAHFERILRRRKNDLPVWMAEAK